MWRYSLVKCLFVAILWKKYGVIMDATRGYVVGGADSTTPAMDSNDHTRDGTQQYCNIKFGSFEIDMEMW